jgi:hypothetical protein
MTRSAARRDRWRKVTAVGLVAVAIAAIIVEPFPKGFVLLSFTHKHGIDAGDIPAIILLLVAAWLAVGPRLSSVPQRGDRSRSR